MGKDWKRRERQAGSPEVPGDYKWSSQSYTLKDILTNFKLPVVVQCREDTNAEHLQNFFFSLRQPILLHNKRTSRKVFARCVRKGEGGTVKELLPEVVIPEDYDGWFKVSRGLAFSKPIPHKSIETLTRSNAEFFLCTTEFNAIVFMDTLEGDDNDSEGFIRPVVEGEVLRKTGIQKLNRLLLPEPERSMNGDDRYLMCIDERDCELFIPISENGLFYEVSDGNFDKNENGVVQISDILDELVELPLYVRHILGDPPRISSLYLPTLKLVRAKEEETVMGSTLECDEEKLPLEIQTNSTIRFEIALNTPMLQSCNEYGEALDLCKGVCENYITEMKLAVNFKMVTLDKEDAINALVHTRINAVLDENDNQGSSSLRTSTGKESELGDVEANSEFKWEPGPSSRNTPLNQSVDKDDAMDDCDSLDSIDSIDSEQAAKLNSVLGGSFFNRENRINVAENHMTPSNLWQQQHNQNKSCQEMGNSGCKDKTGFKFDKNCQNYLNGDDIVEEVTDFSMRRTQKTNHVAMPGSPVEAGLKRRSNSCEIPTSTSNHAMQTFFPALNKSNCSANGAIENDVTAYFPSIQRKTTPSSKQNGVQPGKNGANLHQLRGPAVSDKVDTAYNLEYTTNNVPDLEVSNAQCDPYNLVTTQKAGGNGDMPSITPQHRPYIFTGDVYINNDSYDSLGCERRGDSSIDSLPESIGSWDSSNFRRDPDRTLSPKNGRMHPTPEAVDQMKPVGSIQSPVNLISFDEPSRSPSANSIVTCKVADEMVSSCMDLRLSLEEITRNARDNHVENSWNEFCLERSSSLPVRSKVSPRRTTVLTDEHSQSWEQVSPRRDESVSHTGTQQKEQSRVKSKSRNARSADFGNFSGDKTLLISDTESEDNLAGDTSFTLSESSDMSITDGQDVLLAAFAEMDTYLKAQSNCDSSVRKGSTLTRDKAALTQKIKIRHEIKRKQAADWNDTAEFI